MQFRDLKNPTREENRQTTKHKRIFQGPNSEFVMVRCGTCGQKAICFSHTQTVRVCKDCHEVIWKPTGGRAAFNENCSVISADKYFMEKEN